LQTAVPSNAPELSHIPFPFESPRFTPSTAQSTNLNSTLTNFQISLRFWSAWCSVKPFVFPRKILCLWLSLLKLSAI
jgi:hypothetical protein